MAELPKEVEQQRNADLSPAMMEKARAPRKTWFFERMGDKKIFACEFKEAWQICYNRSAWKRRDFRLLGTSDGKTFKKIIDESISDAQRLAPAIEKKREELNRYRSAEEKLLMDEVVDMDGDPADEFNEANKQKVLRLQKIIERIDGELEALEDEFQDKVTEVVTRATDAELEVAKKNQAERVANDEELDWPDENGNINTPKANPKQRKKIINLVEARAE